MPNVVAAATVEEGAGSMVVAATTDQWAVAAALEAVGTEADTAALGDIAGRAAHTVHVGTEVMAAVAVTRTATAVDAGTVRRPTLGSAVPRDPGSLTANGTASGAPARAALARVGLVEA